MAEADRGPISWGGIVLVVIGATFLLHNFDVIHLTQAVRFWPLVLIAVGVRLILDSRRRAGRSAGKSGRGGPAPPPPSSP